MSEKLYLKKPGGSRYNFCINNFSKFEDSESDNEDEQKDEPGYYEQQEQIRKQYVLYYVYPYLSKIIYYAFFAELKLPSHK